MRRLVAYPTVGAYPHPRFHGLPEREVLWARVPVATTRGARLLGLALLDRHDAGEGLLIPDCRTVHTFGMRFDLDVVFLDEAGKVIELRRSLRPGRVARCAEADSILELPSSGVFGRERACTTP